MAARPTTRREFLRLAASASLATAAGALGCARGAPRRPNVLFIAIDDLNDWVGALGGHPHARTPNLDELARRGVLFANAHCAAPDCGGSRTAVLTGLQPTTSGVYVNRQSFRDSLPDLTTLPQHFMAQGYEVVGGGKIFHIFDAASWHSYLQIEDQPTRDNLVPAAGARSHTARLDWGPIDMTEDEMLDGRVVTWASEWLRSDHERPFFLGVGLYRPHLPWYVPQSYFDLHPLHEVTLPVVDPHDVDDLPGFIRSQIRSSWHQRIVRWGQWREAVAAYLACGSFTDAMVGRLLRALDAGPHRRDTVVVLWSDHGWMLGQKNHWTKFVLWEEATRVPLIVTGPGVVAGGVCRRPVSLTDLYPTLTELCGLPAAAGLDGESLLPLLRDPDAARERPVVIARSESYAVRGESWRYIRYADGGEELYDHASDPREWRNLAGDPDFASVRAELARWIPADPAPQARRMRRFRKGDSPPGDQG